MATQTVIRSGQTIDFSIKVEPIQDITIIFDCHSSPQTSIQIRFIEEISKRSSLFVASCTYPKPGHYQPLISVLNSVSRANRSIRISVEEPLAPFKIATQNHPDISQSIIVTLQSLEHVSFDGLFNFTIMNSNPNVPNSTRMEPVRFSASNDYVEQVYINIATYGQQTLFVSGGDAPLTRQAQTMFTIGTDTTSLPQVYVMNTIARVNEDIVWIDIQWINGIGFDIEIEFDIKHRIRLYYGQLTTTAVSQTIESNENGMHWRRVADRRVQIGFRYSSRKQELCCNIHSFLIRLGKVYKEWHLRNRCNID